MKEHKLEVPFQFLSAPITPAAKLLVMLLARATLQETLITTTELGKIMGYNRIYVIRLVRELKKLGYIVYGGGPKDQIGVWLVDFTPKQPSIASSELFAARKRRMVKKDEIN